MDAHLFLAHADDHEPVLDQGLALDGSFAIDAPERPMDMPQAMRSAKLGSSPDALPDQKWALVVPKGKIGDRLLELIAPLRQKREEEQGCEAFVYRVDPNMDALAASNWMQQEYRDLVSRQESSRPRYLAILGNPDVVSWEFQQMLGGEAFVGRIAFNEDHDYEAYVDKALRHANSRKAALATALFHSVIDGTAATREGYKYLVQPLLAMADSGLKDKTFDVARIVDIPMYSSSAEFEGVTTSEAHFRRATEVEAALLFTLSHGAGVPKDGWISLGQKLEQQGALVLGRKGELLTASDVQKGPFLPGGVWFMFACYGAGTPARSAYMPWLEKLRSLGILGRISNTVLDALPKEGEAPFVAALPRAALANPDGPLGVVGHVDLAWSWSFLDYEVVNRNLAPKSRAERFQGILRAFANGHRFGVAHHELADFFRSLSTEVANSYVDLAYRALGNPGFVDDPISRIRRANLWMQRQDVGAYVLLGDPAARLPIERCPKGLNLTAPAAIDSLDDEELDRRQDIVLAVLRGTTPLGTIAKRHGLSQDEVEHWVEIFVNAGRLALAKTR